VGEGSPNRADAFVWAMSELFPGMVNQKPAALPQQRPRGIGIG
jgi:phage terminase large subunit-like protein